MGHVLSSAGDTPVSPHAKTRSARASGLDFAVKLNHAEADAASSRTLRGLFRQLCPDRGHDPADLADPADPADPAPLAGNLQALQAGLALPGLVWSGLACFTSVQ